MENQSRLQTFLSNPSRSLWTMAIPIIAGMMVQTLFNVVDIMFIGWLGAKEVTAVAFISPLFFIIIGLTVGLGAGVTASIAQFIGKKDKKNADNCAEHTILLGIGITLALSILGILFGEELLVLLGASGEILDIAYTYLKVLLYGIGLVVFSLFFRAILAGEGETKLPMIIGLIGTLLNLILDPIFIFDTILKFSFETFNISFSIQFLGYGVKGAALATVISQAVMFVSYLFIIFIRKSTYITFNISDFEYTPSILKTIFKIGIPSSAAMLIMSFGQAVMNKILINYPLIGVEAVAAYQIVSRIDMLLFMPILGIGISLTTMVGMFFGAKEYKKLIWIIKYGISRAVYITTFSVILLFISAEMILPLFTEDKKVLEIGVTYLRIIILAYPAVGISVICSRICQALGEGMPLLVTTVTRVLILTAPLSYYFYITNKPIEWVWYAQVFAILVAAIISFFWMRFYLKKFAVIPNSNQVKVLKNLSEAQALVGQELGLSKWQKITQFQIWGFGLFTGDRQWIHMRPLKAKLGSPFKTTIAHGFLVLSLLPKILERTYSVASAKMGVNYGLNRVRFTAPVPVGSYVRGRVVLKEFKKIKNGAQLTVSVTVELKGSEKPACVAEQVFLVYE